MDMKRYLDEVEGNLAYNAIAVIEPFPVSHPYPEEIPECIPLTLEEAVALEELLEPEE